jgi:BioD-like phosphotransacetylase family protein
MGQDPSKYTAIGGAPEIMALLDEFRQAGVHKFVLRPIASGTEDMLDQTRQLVEKVLPSVAALN